METSTIALIICAIAIILFVTEKLPLAVTALLAMVAMVFTGVLTASQAFASFGNATVIFVLGFMIVGKAFFTTGLADVIGQKLIDIAGTDLKRVLIVLVVASAVLSAFVSPLAIMAVLFTVVDTLVVKSNGAISRKHCYFAIAAMCTFAGQLTLVGTSSMLNASALLEKSFEGRAIGMFEPTVLTIGGVLLVLIFYLTIGIKVQDKFFNFPDIAPETNVDQKAAATKTLPKWRMIACVVVLILVVVGIAQGQNMGLMALSGAIVLMVLGCIKEKNAYAGVSWSTIFVLIGSMAIASGLEVSGAGALVAQFVVDLAGPLASNAFAMCLIFMVIAVLLSSFMHDTATVVVVLPVALSFCQLMGISALPFALAVARGANIAITTPLCTSTMSYAVTAGYRFKDYVKLGGIFCIGAMITTAITLFFVYFI